MVVGFCDGSFTVKSLEKGVASGAMVFVTMYSSDRSKFLKYSIRHSLHVYDTWSGSVIQTIDNASTTGFTFAIFSPKNSHHIVARCADATIRLFDTSTEVLTSRIIAEKSGTPEGPVMFSKDGAQVVFCSSDGIIHICDLRTQTQHRLMLTIAAQCLPRTLCLSPNK
jgi:WD40 repeat protein